MSVDQPPAAVGPATCDVCGDSPPTETADGRLMCRSCGSTWRPER